MERIFNKLKPYPEYKEAGLPWLGQAPKHWDVLRTKLLFKYRKEINIRRSQKNILSLTLRGVVNNDPNNPEGLVPKDYATYQLFCKGDLVFKLIDLENLRTSRVGLVHEDGIMSPAYVRLTPIAPINIRFFYHQFYDLYSRGIYNQLGAGVRSTLGPSDLCNLPIYIPPPDEQATIVRFLDWSNGRIERAIRAKRKMINLLNEQKQAIIHHAVTRGLDPSVPLKPSGVPWLGDIPQHWKVRRLRHLIEGRLTYGANIAAEFTNPTWLRYLRITDFRADGSLKVDTFRSLPPHIGCDYLVEPGDVLLARSGATVGKAFLVSKDVGSACHAGYLIRARPCRGLISPEFLFAFTQSRAFAAWKDTTFNTATIQNIGADRYANLVVPLPPLAEQQGILSSLANEQAPLLDAISRLEHEIALLREYRTRLVSDVVTGKLDVRVAAANLPKLLEPDILPDEEEDMGENSDIMTGGEDEQVA